MNNSNVKNVHVDDWTAERAIIASNEFLQDEIFKTKIIIVTKTRVKIYIT